MVGIEKYKEQDEKLYQAVAQAQAGRVESINLIYELSKKYIYKIIFDIVKNNEDTEDLMQDTYVQIFNNLHTLENPRAFHVWAGRIATNLTLRYIQKYRHEVLVEANEDGDTDFIFERASEDHEEFIPESVLMDKEKQRLIAEIVDGLSVEQKLAIQYYYYEDMSVKDIASAMQVSEGTVKSRLGYARKAIKTAVVDLDVNKGTRLYSLASLPLFYLVFRENLEAFVMGDVTAASAAGAGVSSGATATEAEAGSGATLSKNAGESAGKTLTTGESTEATASGAASTSADAAGSSSTGKAGGAESKFAEFTKKVVDDWASDFEKAAPKTKELFAAQGQKISEGFKAGFGKGLLAILSAIGAVLKAIGTGFVAGTTATKVLTLAVVAAIVANAVLPNTGSVRFGQAGEEAEEEADYDDFDYNTEIDLESIIDYASSDPLSNMDDSLEFSIYGEDYETLIDAYWDDTFPPEENLNAVFSSYARSDANNFYQMQVPLFSASYNEYDAYKDITDSFTNRLQFNIGGETIGVDVVKAEITPVVRRLSEDEDVQVSYLTLDDGRKAFIGGYDIHIYGNYVYDGDLTANAFYDDDTDRSELQAQYLGYEKSFYVYPITSSSSDSVSYIHYDFIDDGADYGQDANGDYWGNYDSLTDAEKAFFVKINDYVISNYKLDWDVLEGLFPTYESASENSTPVAINDYTAVEPYIVSTKAVDTTGQVTDCFLTVAANTVFTESTDDNLNFGDWILTPISDFPMLDDGATLIEDGGTAKIYTISLVDYCQASDFWLSGSLEGNATEKNDSVVINYEVSEIDPAIYKMYQEGYITMEQLTSDRILLKGNAAIAYQQYTE